ALISVSTFPGNSSPLSGWAVRYRGIMRKNADTFLVATVLFVSALGSGLAWYRQCLRAPMVLAASPGYLAAEQAEETIYQIYRRTYRTYSRTSGEHIDEGTLHLYGAVTCGITSFVYLFVLAAQLARAHVSTPVTRSSHMPSAD